MNSRIRFFFSGILILVAVNGCGVYSFTGVSITAKTMTITDFLNDTDLGPANLAQTFTNSLKDYFIQNTSLSIVPGGGELQMEGVVSGYRVSQVAPSAATTSEGISTAALSRLTITVKVNYINTLDETMSFKNKTFSFYADFTNDQILADVEERLTKQIFDQIILDIFNASVANW